MKISGIVAEFNPLHNGHEYIISETRRLTGCESVCIAMSGNYVQRGEPAILDKWTRAETALRAGADLIVEIPTLFCLSDASRYASAGVAILEALNKNMHICCGSESADAVCLNFIAGFMQDNMRSIDRSIAEMIRDGLSYPLAREKALLALMKERRYSSDDINRVKSILGRPNDILALEYAMSAKTSEITYIERKGAGYDDAFSIGPDYQSAGGIRKLISERGMDSAYELLKECIPSFSLNALTENELSLNPAWTGILRYAASMMSPQDIDECPSGGEGLGNLIREAVLKYDSWEDIIMHCKSKRYTYTRLSRLCMQIVLGIGRKDYKSNKPEYIRVLGFSNNGRKLLSRIKREESCSIPIITNINREKMELAADAVKMLELDLRAADVYNMVLGRDSVKYSDFRMKPVII